MEENKLTYWFIICSGCVLLRKDANGTFSVPLAEESPVAQKEWTVVQELPSIDGIPCKAFAAQTVPADAGLQTVGIRESYNRLPRKFYNMVGKAAELLYWNDNTKYCGYCGAPMKRSTEISKVCANCGKEVWPQVAPAIIVRVLKAEKRGEDGTVIEPEQILLVHAKNFRRGEMYGLVAGFLETGETLEDCVRRELQEETNIRVRNIRYFGSQPWPYPCGVMIGFTADYDGGEIHLQEEEISSGGWYSRQNLPQIPDKMSIARQLIDDWLG